MNTKNKSWNWQLWLTSFIATSGAWTYFGSSTFAQNAGTITVNTSNTSDLIIRNSNSTSSPGAIAGDSIINLGSVLSASRSGGGSAGTITINASVSSSPGAIAGDSIINLGSVLSASRSGGGSAGTITINASPINLSSVPEHTSSSSSGLIARDNIIINSGSMGNPSGSVLSASGSGSAGGNIMINAPLIRVRPVPEQTSTLGLLSFTAFNAAFLVLYKHNNIRT